MKGDRQAFPVADWEPGEDKLLHSDPRMGMTYRQWLIGMVASGVAHYAEHGNGWCAQKTFGIVQELLRLEDQFPCLPTLTAEKESHG